MKNNRLILGLVAALALASPAFSQNTGSFTLSTAINDDGTLTPTLSWTTTPEATSCNASGDAAWSGTKAGSGSETLAPIPKTTPKSYALVCDWPGDRQALLTWSQPTTNTDGSPLTDLASYRVMYGQSATALNENAVVPAPASSYTISNLDPGSWYFAVVAINALGAESELSNIATKVMRDGVQWSQQTGVKIPNAPVLNDPE
jgi:hypothetical protein